jgi:serine protease Do
MSAPRLSIRLLVACLFTLSLTLSVTVPVYAHHARGGGVAQTGAQPAPIDTLEDAQSAVIQIEAVGAFVDPSEGMQQNQPGYGSGFIIDPSGIAVTNHHVVSGGALFKVYIAGEDKPVNARVLGVSECSDLAVIDLQGSGYPYLTWYERPIRVGLDVYALGFPLGDPEFTMTRGIVAKARADGESNWASVDRVIQHDATINPGNSGGPLVNEDGQVVGVNYAGDDENNQYFAIAADIAIPIVEQLAAGNDLDSIGVNGEAFETDDGVSGIWVYSVDSGSPADGVGVLPGDIIVELEGVSVGGGGLMTDYCDIISSHDPSRDVLAITIYRPDTDELLAGQMNGRPLAAAQSIAAEVEGEEITAESTGDTESIVYVPLSDESGTIHMETPEVWSEVQERPWKIGDKEKGVQLIATPNLDDFFSSWDIPGVIFSYSDIAQEEFEPTDMLDTIDYSDDCKYLGRTELGEDGFYRGVYDEYEGCGDSDTQALVAVLTPQTSDYMIGIELYTVSDADIAAVDHLLDTFYVEMAQENAGLQDIFELVDVSGLDYEYVLVNEPSFSALVPADWDDVAAEEWTTEDGEALGDKLTISSDAQDFSENWDIAGLTVRTMTDPSTDLNIDDLLDSFDMSDSCTFEERQEHTHTIYGITYTGKYDIYTNCGGEDNVYATLLALPDAGDHLFWIDYVAIEGADIDAFDVLLQSFYLASAAQAVEPTVNPEGFTEISDDAGFITISVPNDWADVESGDWESDGDVVGKFLTASPSLDDFNSGWETPGMWVAIPNEIGNTSVDDVLDSFDFSDFCTYDQRYDYEDERFVGKYDFWTVCNDIEGSLFATFALQPVDNDQTGVVMYVYMPSEDDIAALEPLLLTLTLGAGQESAPESPASLEEVEPATATVIVDTLNVRAGPGTDYQRIASVSADTSFNVIGQVENCAWLLVEDEDGEQGWISGAARFVTLDGDCAAIPDASDQVTAQPQIAGQQTSGNARQGCITFKNQVGSELVITFTRRGDNWNTTFSVAKAQSGQKCLDPGR